MAICHVRTGMALRGGWTDISKRGAFEHGE